MLDRKSWKEVGIFTLVCIVSTLVACYVGLLVGGCAGMHTKSAEHPHPVKEYVTKFAACMVTPPPVEDIDWPDKDTVGNILMHETTAERVKAAYAVLVRWSREQFYRCLKAAEDANIDPTTVEVTPADDGGVP